jgi:hypothetical protein
MGARHIVDHPQPLAEQLNEAAPDGLDYVFGTIGTDRNLAVYAETVKPFGRIVAVDDFDSVPMLALKWKSISLHWEFVFTRSMFQTPDQAEQHRILTELAQLVDAGTVRSTATEDFGRGRRSPASSRASPRDLIPRVRLEGELSRAADTCRLLQGKGRVMPVSGHRASRCLTLCACEMR